MRWLGWTAVAILATLLAARGATLQERDDDDEMVAQLARARLTFEENCQMCHAAELTTSQRLTPKQWAAEVDKMIGWGAPVPAEAKSDLIDYLALEYGSDRPSIPPRRLTPREAGKLNHPAMMRLKQPGGDAERGQALYATNCASCHGKSAEGGDLGTSLAEKPVLLDLGEYQAAVRDGRRRMPAFSRVLTADQESDILNWLRGLRRP